MKAMLYMPNRDEPVAVLDDVTVIEYDDNHKKEPTRIYYKSQRLNASKVMLELHRDEKFKLKLDDGRSANVLLQHSSLDSTGNAVGVLRIIGGIAESAAAGS